VFVYDAVVCEESESGEGEICIEVIDVKKK
jgi:hypothetical protein